MKKNSNKNEILRAQEKKLIINMKSGGHKKMCIHRKYTIYTKGGGGKFMGKKEKSSCARILLEAVFLAGPALLCFACLFSHLFFNFIL